MIGLLFYVLYIVVCDTILSPSWTVRCCAMLLTPDSGEKEKERERDRDRQTETDRQTERDRERERDTDRQTERLTET